MNSFSYGLKKEVASIFPTSQEEAISELSAIIKTCGEISKNGKDYKLVIKSEFLEVCELANKLVSMIYGFQNSDIKTEKIFSKNSHMVEFTNNASQILQDAEILIFDEQKYLQINNQISSYMIAEQNLAQSYLRGAFLGSFSSNINLTGESFENRSTGYHAEFVFENQQFAQNFGLFLADFDIISKMVERKGLFVVYVKDFDMICDILILCGANKGVLALQNESAMRSLRNNINRQTNCISANLTKTVDASIRQMEAIDAIRDTIGIDSLDENLKSACYLRIANPEESLDNLAKLSNPAISKSALYRHFKKIEKIASELKK